MKFRESITPVTSGHYEARLLRNKKELKEYQRLRYTHLLLHYNPTGEDRKRRYERRERDFNMGYDRGNSQLCVFYIDPKSGKRQIVGGYLLMRFREEDSFCKAVLKYDLTKLLDKYKYQVLELGRVVTHPDHRNGVVLKLLWAGVEAYIKAYNLRWVIGTTNFSGADPKAFRAAAGYLCQNYLMPAELMATVLDGKGYPFDPDAASAAYDREEAIAQLPPILKEYLRMGAEVGSGFYSDKELKSVAIFTIMDVQNYGVRRPLK